MGDHVVTVIAVYKPGGQPFAAECSCGLKWHTPDHWREAAMSAASGMEPTDRAYGAQEAEANAMATFDLWARLHPTVPAPRPRKARPEVVRELTTCWLGDMGDATVRMEQLVIAYCATEQEQRLALDNYGGLGGLDIG